MKILYIMGVEWDWIYQRPHILAELLNKKNDVVVACPKQPYHIGRKRHNSRTCRLIELLQIPFQEKLFVVEKVADFFHKRMIGNISQYDLVWVGFPLYIRYIPKDYKGQIVYDCMDNHEALFCDQSTRGVARLMRLERELINRADLIFASAQKLSEKIKDIKQDAKVEIVRNAYSELDIVEPRGTLIRNTYKLAYIGTVSEWFDNSVIEESLARISNIKYSIIGPFSKYKPIEDKRVEYLGTIKHNELANCTQDVDCFIMPFIVNDIIRYVDPVKFYEYIAWGKCIVAPYYPEIERFRDFVYFYNSQEEYCEIISKLATEGFKTKYSAEIQRTFLADNTWKERIKIIECELGKIVSGN